MRPLAFVGVGLALATIQAVVLLRLGGGTVPLQIVVPCIAWLALEAENVEGVLAAAGSGWVLDLFAGTPTGLFTFLGVVLFLGCRAAGLAVDLRGRAGFAVLSGVAALALSVGAVLLQRWAGLAEAAPGAGLVLRMFGEATLTALVSPLVLIGMGRLNALLGREEPGIVP